MTKYNSPYSIAFRKPVYIYNNDPRAVDSQALERYRSRSGSKVIVKNAPNIQIQSGTAGDYREPPEYSNAFNGGYFYTLQSGGFIFWGPRGIYFNWPTNFAGDKNGNGFNYNEEDRSSIYDPQSFQNYYSIGTLCLNQDGSIKWNKEFLASGTNASLAPSSFSYPTSHDSGIFLYGGISDYYSSNDVILKINKDGLVWCKKFISSAPLVLYSNVSQVYKNNNLYGIRYAQITGSGVPGLDNEAYLTFFKMSNSGEIPLVFGVSLYESLINGKELWDCWFSNGNWTNTIATDEGNMYGVATYSITENGVYHPCILVMCLDAINGSFKWAKTIVDRDISVVPGSYYDWGARHFWDIDLVCDSSGVYVKAHNYDGYSQPNATPRSGTRILKLSKNGNLIWAKKFSTKTSESAGFDIDSNGKLYWLYHEWGQDKCGIVKLNPTSGNIIYSKGLSEKWDENDDSEALSSSAPIDNLRISGSSMYLSMYEYLIKTPYEDSTEWTKQIYYSSYVWDPITNSFLKDIDGNYVYQNYYHDIILKNNNVVIGVSHTNIEIFDHTFSTYNLKETYDIYTIDATDQVVSYDVPISESEKYNLPISTDHVKI